MCRAAASKTRTALSGGRVALGRPENSAECLFTSAIYKYVLLSGLLIAQSGSNYQHAMNQSP